MTRKLATLVSGGGSTMEKIIEATYSKEIPDTIVNCVIASNATAGAIDRAFLKGIPNSKIAVVNPKDFCGSDRKVDQVAFGGRILEILREHDIDVVTQNGWMPKTPQNVIEAYEGNIFNQHPGPPEEFGGKGMYGRRVHAAVLLFRRLIAKDMWTQVVGQRVHKEFDKGQVVASERVDIQPTDTVEDLAERALKAEHRVQIAMLQDWVRGGLAEQVIEPIAVTPQEQIALATAKQMAIHLYPRG